MTGRKLRRALVLALVTAAAALAIPAVAGAATYCVGPAACGGIPMGDNLQAALDAAENLGGDDLVLVSDKGSPYVGPFTYLPSVAGNGVVIQHSGTGRPLLTAGVGEDVLTIKDATVEGVDVRSASSSVGTGIRSKRTELKDVTVSAVGTNEGGVGIAAAGGTTLKQTRVVNHGDTNLHTTGGGDVFANDVELANAATGVAVDADTPLDLRRARVTSRLNNAFVRGETHISSSALITTDPEAIGVYQDGPLLGLDHVTIARRSPGNGSDRALSLNAIAGNGSAFLTSVALAGYSQGIERGVTGGHTLDLDVTDSVWDSARDVLGGALAGTFKETGNIHVEPPLVDLAAGDLRPRGGSVMIDSELHVERLAGFYRDLDGVGELDGDGNGSELLDAGAFEYRRRPPAIAAVHAPLAGTTGASLPFTADVADPDGDPVQVKWDFGDGAAGSGSATSHAYAAPGTYQVTVTAIDSVGLSATRQVMLSASAGAGAGNVAGAAGVAADKTAPALSSVRLSSKSAALARVRKLRLRFKVSEAATLKIVAKRRIGGRTVRVRGAIVRKVKPGAGSLALARGLRRLKLLRPGKLVLTVRAIDSAGNRSAARVVKLTLHR
jgi:hypothetical protein